MYQALYFHTCGGQMILNVALLIFPLLIYRTQDTVQLRMRVVLLYTAIMLTVSERDVVFVLNKLLMIVNCGILAIKNFPYASLTCCQTHGRTCSYIRIH